MRTLRLFLLAVLSFSPALGSAAEDLLPADRPLEQVVDHYVDVLVKQENINIAPPADDATFIRRVSLDLVGRIPTMGETKAYVASTDSQKKVQLVERLLASPAFVRHQATMFDAMMSATPTKRGGSGSLNEYFNLALGEDRPWNQIFRELLTPDDNDPKRRRCSAIQSPP